MANKRMFTMKIVDSDAFLDMPLSSQCLYFHLNMRADDDGFIGNPKRIMKIVGASEDDLKLLIAKRFLLVFENGVIVIKHWRMHNTLSQNRYHETQYKDEKSFLRIKENGSYSLNKGQIIDDSKLIEAKEKYDKSRRLTNGLQAADTDKDLDLDKDLGLDLDSELDLDLDQDKDLEKDIVITVSKDTVCQTEVRQIMESWNELQSVGIKPVIRLSKKSKRYGNLIARIKEYGTKNVISAIERIKLSDYCQGKNKYGWVITFDWFVLPSNFPKVFEGNYDNRSASPQFGNSDFRNEQFERLMEQIRRDEENDN